MRTKNKGPITLYLIGLAGTGKLTIAHRLQPLGFKIADNHLINNPILKLLPSVGKIPAQAWEAITKIRQVVFQYIAHDRVQDFILTNDLTEGRETDREWYENVQSLAGQRGSFFIPVRLLISKAERARRILSEGRKDLCKLTEMDHRPSFAVLSIEHPHLLTLDVTQLSAPKAAARIQAHIRKIVRNDAF